GVVKPIILTDSTATASWDSLNNEMLNALVSQGLYINVHTQKYPAGEIRGQVLPVLLLISQPVTSVDNKKAFPEKYTLEQNYPNPFNPVTTISYTIPKAGRVTIKVFNLLGQETALLVNENQNAGNYKVSFDGSRLPSGTYFYRMEAGDVLLTKKLMILK
ncbi:MAG: T9SS type A sorting domain-containing protein, partial [Syntrophothermus sp.]